MKFRTVSLTDVSPDDRLRWQRLADRAADPNPNADPRFLHTSLGCGLAAEKVRLGIVETDDDFALVLPFTMARTLSGAPLRHATTSGEFMFDQASKYHPLIAPEEPQEALRALFLGMRDEGFGDFLSLTAFPLDGPLFAALDALRQEGTLRVAERSRDRRALARRTDIDPDGTVWDEEGAGPLSYPMPHLSKRTRRNARRSMERLEAAADGSLRIREVEASDELIEEFLELQAAGWKGDASKDGPQFRRRGREPWFRSVLEAFQAGGRLRAWHVTAGEHTVYIAFTLISGGQSFGFHDVYSENFESFSPGFVGRLALIGALMREPEAPPFDPGMEPTYVQAGAAFPSHREYAELLVAGPSLRARMAVGAYPALRRARTRLRRRAS